jgi:hypothetical protein
METPKPKAAWTRKKVLIVGGSLIAVMAIISGEQDPVVKANAKLEADKLDAIRAPMLACVRSWEAHMLKSLKDPESLTWDKDDFQTIFLKQKSGNVPIVKVAYRAKNGYGAMTKSYAVCQLNDPPNERTVKLVLE